MEDGFRLTTVSRLLAVVSTLSLCDRRGLRRKYWSDSGSGVGKSGLFLKMLWTDLAGLVLCDFVLRVFLAVLAFAVGATCLGNVDLCTNFVSYTFSLDF